MAERFLGSVVAGVWLLSMTGSAQIVLPSIDAPQRVGVQSPPTRFTDLPRRDETPPSRPEERSAGRVDRSGDRDSRSAPGGSRITQAPGGDLFRAGPGTYAPRPDRTSTPPRHHQRILPGHGYFGGDATSASMMRPASPSTRVIDVEPRGYLRLLVQPGAAQIRVDGLYLGTVDDFIGSPPLLEAGPRRVEIRAPGFETVTFDVRILENETITYRRSLGTVDDSPPAPPRVPAAAPKTFYVIPGCYAGDSRPRPAQLPPGCDAANLRTVPPQS